MGSGVRQGLNYDEVKELRIVLPSQEEQDAIVAFLDEQSSKIDAIVEECCGANQFIKEYRSLIGDLELYKRSLIYEAVTGKRKVV